MCGSNNRKVSNKVDIIDALLHKNLYKMPDGRQFYEATEKELENILFLHTDTEKFCSV
ncbi:hypothetical protein [Metabacillus sediminilitoris]|jgi:hypothetical protein|uniref:hypothetical protein n=1 Tax=Metabacillus sediminilitoris TaxID=2567941 RepID=UPI0012D83997|nr:hypothetical protein [Metabacillus sediminilitoris]QGQ46261.1 hypothetical protein GMB29_14165 [Metabacillus sediminilitoris]